MEVGHLVLACPHGVDLSDHVTIVLPANQDMVSATESDGPRDTVLFPVGQTVIRSFLHPLNILNNILFNNLFQNFKLLNLFLVLLNSILEYAWDAFGFHSLVT